MSLLSDHGCPGHSESRFWDTIYVSKSCILGHNVSKSGYLGGDGLLVNSYIKSYGALGKGSLLYSPRQNSGLVTFSRIIKL